MLSLSFYSYCYYGSHVYEYFIWRNGVRALLEAVATGFIVVASKVYANVNIVVTFHTVDKILDRKTTSSCLVS